MNVLPIALTSTSSIQQLPSPHVLTHVNISELILGAILGILFAEVYERIIKNIVNRFYKDYLLRKRRKLLNSIKVRDFVFEYYTANKSFTDLFVCHINGYSDRIPFLTNNKWINRSIDIYRVPNIIVQSEGAPLRYLSSSRIIRKRERIGQKLFNNKALYLSCILPTGEIEVKSCDFFQKLTLVDRLETETLKAAKHQITKTKIRDDLLYNFEKALSPRNLPVSMGCHVVFILKRNGKLYVALQRRSNETFTYGGAIAVVPVFGLVPIPKHDSSYETDSIKSNVLFYNIIKEYCEELHDEKILQGKENHTNPFWFYEKINEAKDLIKSIEEKKSFCEFLGYGFDAINGLSILAALLFINDDVLSQNIYDNCKANWEILNSEIMFYDIDAIELKNYLKTGQMQNGTAFALSLALKAIKKY